MLATFVPHADFGDPDCPGFLFGIVRDLGYIECNDCDVVIRTVPAADLQRTLNEMELSQEFCTEKCPHCGNVNLFPGFSEMLAYICKHCGESVKVSNDPD